MALQETVKKADLPALGARLAAGLAAGAWSVPTLILTGDADKYIKVLSEARALRPGALLRKERVLSSPGAPSCRML